MTSGTNKPSIIIQLDAQANKVVKLRDLESKIAALHMEKLTREERALANNTDNPIGFLQGIYSSIFATLESQSEINTEENVIDFSKYTHLKNIETASDKYGRFAKAGLFIDEKTESVYISGTCLTKSYKTCISQSALPELTLRLWDIGLKAFTECDDYAEELKNNSFDIIEL